MSLIYLSIASFLAWVVSTLAGGGSPFVLIPLVNLMLGASAVPPVITLGMFVGNAHRIALFWRDIDWKLTAWYAPGAIVGAVLGAYTFTQLHLEWLQLFIGVFLVISVAGFIFEKKDDADSVTQEEPTFRLQAWHILPAAFVKAFVSGLVGTTGPVLNPFYLSYGLVKEQLIATKATHVVIIHTVKLITYGTLGALSFEEIQAGLAIGLAAIPANLVGKYLLQRLNAKQFRQLVLGAMVVSGIWMLWGQRSMFGAWWS